MTVYPPQVIERFWSCVDKGDGDGCWLWTGTAHPFGYGNLSVNVAGTRFQTLTHRFSWEIHFGPIPEGLCVCHRCDVPGCVRPDHLWLGTDAQNHADMVAKGRHSTGDRSGVRKYPWKYRGDRHWTHRHPELVKRGEDTPQARLSEAQAQEILDAVQCFADCVEYAGRFGVSVATIHDVWLRKTWKHLPGETKRLPSPDHLEVAAGRLWAKVARHGDSECWPWTGARNSKGQGVFSFEGKSTSARSVAYRFLVGPVPVGQCVWLTCGTPACCNPAHMELRENRPHVDRWEARRRRDQAPG